MANVKANLLPTIKRWSAFKDVIFYRQSDYFKPKIIEVEIENRLGFAASAQKTNNDLKSFQII
jgi:hypothetical protein